MGAPLLLLTTVGAKTGKTRRTVLGWFPDGDKSWLVVASYAGAARHPAWYFNLAKNPDKVWIEVGKREVCGRLCQSG
ncbi:MAG: nitroreductase family deazaflavin-dependent oxidoreductase [Chloroflexi bacterium]|nr:nitroreductase family deazaflavin-dependent oxidoreductase [Chloroflexota bacterium]